MKKAGNFSTFSFDSLGEMLSFLFKGKRRIKTRYIRHKDGRAVVVKTGNGNKFAESELCVEKYNGAWQDVRNGNCKFDEGMENLTALETYGYYQNSNNPENCKIADFIGYEDAEEEKKESVFILTIRNNDEHDQKKDTTVEVFSTKAKAIRHAQNVLRNCYKGNREADKSEIAKKAKALKDGLLTVRDMYFFHYHEQCGFFTDLGIRDMSRCVNIYMNINYCLEEKTLN